MEQARPNQIRLGDAARAMRALLKNPDDTSQVFRVIEALSGRSGERMLKRFKGTVNGRRFLKQASLDTGPHGRRGLPEDAEFLRTRMRDTHDLWHVVAGYHGDLVGEASLLAFILAQTRNPGIGFIVAIALLRGREASIRRLITQGFMRGVRAAWLPAVEWEQLLALPLETVRRELRIGRAPDYDTVRSADYRRAMGTVEAVSA
jgi:ubiquinone biosynthesis protein COQ4